MITLSLPSNLNELDKVLEFVTLGQEVAKGPTQFWIELLDTVQKIYINIVKYAYHTCNGIVKISLNYNEEQQAIEVLFLHEGIPYNPLEELSLPSEIREDYEFRAGFGMSMLEKSSQTTSYIYKDNKNRTTVKKYLS